MLTAELLAARAREAALLREKSDLSRRQVMLAQEFEHRLLNGLQLIASLLSLQSRAATTPEAAAQLAIAARRVTGWDACIASFTFSIIRTLRSLRSISNISARIFQVCCSRKGQVAPSWSRERIVKYRQLSASLSASLSTSSSLIRRNTRRAISSFELKRRRPPVIRYRCWTMDRDYRQDSIQRKARDSE